MSHKAEKIIHFYGPGRGAGRGAGRMAKKIACGYFLLLCNKKQLILMALFLAAAAATETDGRKNNLRFAEAIFYCCAIKNN